MKAETDKGVKFSSRGGGYAGGRQQWSYDHALEVFHEAKQYDEIFDCTLIKKAKENKDLLCQPIYHFTEQDIWRYIQENNIEVNPLYSMGYKRIGCIGCPMAGKNRYKEFKDFPMIERAYKAAFRRMLEARKSKGLREDFVNWKDEEAVFKWWMDDKNIVGQMNLFEGAES